MLADRSASSVMISHPELASACRAQAADPARATRAPEAQLARREHPRRSSRDASNECPLRAAHPLRTPHNLLASSRSPIDPRAVAPLPAGQCPYFGRMSGAERPSTQVISCVRVAPIPRTHTVKMESRIEERTTLEVGLARFVNKAGEQMNLPRFRGRLVGLSRPERTFVDPALMRGSHRMLTSGVAKALDASNSTASATACELYLIRPLPATEHSSVGSVRRKHLLLRGVASGSHSIPSITTSSGQHG